MLGITLWLIFIFLLCCGAAGSIGFILLLWAACVVVTVILFRKDIIKK